MSSSNIRHMVFLHTDIYRVSAWKDTFSSSVIMIIGNWIHASNCRARTGIIKISRQIFNEEFLVVVAFKTKLIDTGYLIHGRILVYFLSLRLKHFPIKHHFYVIVSYFLKKTHSSQLVMWLCAWIWVWTDENSGLPGWPCDSNGQQLGSPDSEEASGQPALKIARS